MQELRRSDDKDGLDMPESAIESESSAFDRMPKKDLEKAVCKMLDGLGLYADVCIAGPKMDVVLARKEGHRHIICHHRDGGFFSMFSTAREICQRLANDIDFIVVGNEANIEERIENPYLGCRSLEEAMVRKDLAGMKGEKEGNG